MIYENLGIEGNKKIKGRKRQILVDVLGEVLLRSFFYLIYRWLFGELIFHKHKNFEHALLFAVTIFPCYFRLPEKLPSSYFLNGN